MKKGFTLVELLGVLVVISLVSLIVTPKITELFHKKQLEASEAFKETIFLATRQYITNNEYSFSTGAAFYCVTVGTLVEKGELVDPVVDVITGNKIDYETNVEVVVDSNNNYQFDYNTERCSQDDITAPIISVQRSVSVDKTNVTLTVNSVDDSPLADLPYSFDGGTTWQLSNQKVINDSYNATIKVKDTYNNIASLDYSISKLIVDASGGVWNSLTEKSVFWLEKNERMTIANPLKMGNTFNGWNINNLESVISGTSFKMGSANTEIIAKWSLTQFTLTVDTVGGLWAGTTNQTLTIGQTVIIDDPKKLGNVFGGWTISGTGSTISDTTFTMGSADTTLTAVWYTYANMYTYTGTSQVIDDGDYNWRIKFLTSGTLNFKVNVRFDIFLVGGGSSRGGSGYTQTYTTLTLTKNTNYSIVVGAGGVPGADGTASTAFGKTANPGSGINGGSGGGASGYVNSGLNGASDGNASSGCVEGACGGTGQGTTTREFGESNGTLYAGGGGGGAGSGCKKCTGNPPVDYTAYGGAGGSGGGGNGGSSSCANGGTNTGGGAGLAIRGTASCSGGTGIVIMRSSRVLDIYTYTGDSFALNDGDGNWRIKLLTSGTFIPKINMVIDLFLVGGGGGSPTCSSDSAGGSGGGFTLTQKTISLTANTAYPVTIGAGGGTGARGGTTSMLSKSAEGGYPSSGNTGGNGGSGGGYGGPWNGSYYCCAGAGASNGGSAGANCASGGTGQGTTTSEFGDANGTLYSGGGGGYGGYNTPCGDSGKVGGLGGGGTSGVRGATNTGGGGGACAVGGSGIAIIRNTR